MCEIKASVCYRTGKLTKEDYDEAIEALQNARDFTDAQGCPVCHDGHDAAQCHHNPLVLARNWTAATAVWQCWHCGFIATNEVEARGHFGEPFGVAECQREMVMLRESHDNWVEVAGKRAKRIAELEDMLNARSIRL